MPGGGEILFFDGDKGTTMTNNLSSTNRYRINFGSSTASRTINGSSTNTFYDYSNNVPAIYNNSGVSHTVNFPISIGNTSTLMSIPYGMEINAENGVLNVGSSITAANSTGIKVLVLMESSSGNGSNINVSGVISNGSGTMALVKKDQNTATLTGANTYTGTTTINGGTLIANSTSALGNGSNVTITSGTLEIQESLTIGDLTVSSGATLTIASGKTLTVNGVLTLNNSIDLGGGNILIGAGGSISGTFSNSNLIITSGTGSLRKTFSSAASFLYPVGTAGEYTPVTLNFTALSGSSYAGVRSIASVHPSLIGSYSDYLERNWDLTDGGFTSFSCDITCTYVDADIVGTESNIYCGKYSSGTWVSASATNTAANSLSFAGATSFSQITGAQLSALPIDLINFNGMIENGLAKLYWSTASETNASHFAIHKSLNGVDKNAIGVVTAVGNSNELQNYSFVDVQPVNQVAYYFLEQVDFDGKSEWFGPVKVTNSKIETVTATFGNNNEINITISNPEITQVDVKLYNVAGQLINATALSGDRLGNGKLRTEELPSGIYMLYLQADGMQQAIKLVK